MKPGNSEFDSFRRERNQRRVQSSGPQRPLGKGQDALREIEAAEAREIQEHRLTKDVNEFLADATRAAATIMNKVTEAAANASSGRIRNEVEEFLHETIQRVQLFISHLQRTDSRIAEQNIEAQVRNIVGPILDKFRYLGTAQLSDKHIGQDPFSVSLEKVQREVTGKPSQPPVTEDRNLDSHLVAEVAEGSPPAPPVPVDIKRKTKASPAGPKPKPTEGEPKLSWNLPANAETQPKPVEEPKSPLVKPRLKAKEPVEAPAPAPATSAAVVNPLLSKLGHDPEKLKRALKALVNDGVLEKQEALEIFREQLKNQ